MPLVPDLTVLELNRSVGAVLQASFPGPMWVRGVITGLRRVSGRGHTYFQLADPAEPGEQSPAVVDCALFAGDRTRISMLLARQAKLFDLTDNTEVRLLVSVNFWDRSGRFQLVMKDFDPEFTGDSTSKRLNRLFSMLEKEGILKENATLPFPQLPLTVGLVTSKDSAAEKDFLKTLDESGYPFKVFAAYASMQGVSTSDSVCEAFNRLIVSTELDVAVITRGGGAATDLSWFNDEKIARTISQLPWPVISGIGHEIDTTLPDYAAHTRAKTPTHAAAVLVDRVAEFDDRVANLRRSLASTVSPVIRMEEMRVKNLAGNLSLHLASLPSRKSGILQQLASKLNMATISKLHMLESQLAESERQIEIRDPERMLKLGWAVVRDKNGLPLRSADSITTGQTIKVSMNHGTLTATVTGTERETPDG